MFIEEITVTENLEVGKGYYLLKGKAKGGVLEGKPGQFYMLKTKNKGQVLRRPISLHSINKEKKRIEFYYETLGEGTKEFASLKEGETLNIQGPLGNGFDMDHKGKKVVIVGGGMGMAPLKLLGQWLEVENEVTYILGGRNQEALEVVKVFEGIGDKQIITSDDGSIGVKGYTTDRLKEHLEKEKTDIIFSCGPHIMMEKVGEIGVENNIPTFVSLEKRMACGVKACVGCSIKTKKGMKKVCYDGPVFNFEDLIDTKTEFKGGCNG